MESIKEKLKKSKSLLQYIQNTWFFAIAVSFLASVVIFGSIWLGYLFKAQDLLTIRVNEASFPTNLSGKEGTYIGSKTGKTYYFPWCASANRIKDGNLVWFRDRASAEALGYKPAPNCHGLK